MSKQEPKTNNTTEPQDLVRVARDAILARYGKTFKDLHFREVGDLNGSLWPVVEKCKRFLDAAFKDK